MKRRDFLWMLSGVSLSFVSIGAAKIPAFVSRKRSGVAQGEFLEVSHPTIGSFTDFNSLLIPGKLTLIASRPSVGKSAFAYRLVAHTAFSKNLGSAFFSLEQRRDQILTHLLEDQLGFSADRVKRRDLSPVETQKLFSAVRKLSYADVFIEETAGQTTESIKNQVIDLKTKQSVSLVVVDYLQLVQHRQKFSSRANQINQIVSDLKELAVKEKVAVVLLSQINRPLDKIVIPDVRQIRELTDYSMIDGTLLLFQKSGATRYKKLFWN